MERLTKRAFILGGALFVFGIGIQLMPQAVLKPRTEQWMESLVPDQVGSYRFIPGQENPRQSYRMDQTTYDALKPFGIVSRRYQKGDDIYDVVVIAGSEGKSFHDPRVCFTSQGFQLTSDDVAMVPTKTRGDVAMTLAKTLKGDQVGLAGFLYRTPTDKFEGRTMTLRFDLLVAKLIGINDVYGVFYRFIPLTDTSNEAKLKAFIGDYMDAAKASSNGAF